MPKVNSFMGLAAYIVNYTPRNTRVNSPYISIKKRGFSPPRNLQESRPSSQEGYKFGSLQDLRCP